MFYRTKNTNTSTPCKRSYSTRHAITVYLGGSESPTGGDSNKERVSQTALWSLRCLVEGKVGTGPLSCTRIDSLFSTSFCSTKRISS